MGFFAKSTKSTIRADKISDFSVATTEYGSPVREILGTTRIAGNVIYYDDFTAHEHRSTQRSGKGGGGHKTTTITYTYTVAIIMALCEGEVSGIGKVWIDKDLYVYPHSGIQMTLYRGTADQQPWPYTTSRHPDKALPYPNLAYMAGVIDLGESAGLPQFNFEVKGKLLDTGDGIDVNPADYIEYVLRKVGFDGEIAGIDNYREYCKAADFLISTPSDDSGARPAREIVNEIAELTNAYMFWSNDRFKIVPREDRTVKDWNPDRTILYSLTSDDFLPQAGGACVTYQRKDSSELYNRFSVEFINRTNGYEKETVSYEDAQDIELYGVRQADTVNAHYIYKKERAVALAESLARRNKYERNKYTFKLGWAFCRLETGDLVMLTDPALGIENLVVMIDSLTESATGELTFTAIGRADGDYSEAKYDVHENERPFIDFNFQAGDVAAPAIFQPPADLMHNDNEVWIAIKGQNPYWGGCNVWVSENNTSYELLGTVTSPARYGRLVKGISAEATELETDINAQLIGGTTEDAENGNTLLWVDGECMSYTTAELLENGNYKLSGLVRGQYSTEATAHGAGEQVVRCDNLIYKTSFLDNKIGKLIYLKFTSFNIFESNEQSLADVALYEYVISERTTRPPDVTSLDVEVLHNGTRRYYWGFEYPQINNIAGFRMKYIQGARPNWARGFDVQDGLITTQPYETNTVRQGTHTVMIKAVDVNGNESENYARIQVHFAEPLEDNVLFKVDFSENNWQDVETDGIILNDGYIHSLQSASFWNGADLAHWEGRDSYYWHEIYYDSFELKAQVAAPAGGNFYLHYDIDGPADLTYKILNKDTLYKPYAAKFEVNAGDIIEIKFNSAEGVDETILRKLIAIIDVPDREEHFENITIPASGLELPIVTPNYQTTTVRIDSVNTTEAGIYQPEVVSNNPCVVKINLVTNTNGQWQREAVEAVADITWQGFTKQTV